MRLGEITYHLPEELIAQRPLGDRAASRLLVLHKDTGQVEHRTFRDAPEYLESGDLLVLNDTRVSALRLYGNRPTGGKVEALLLRDLGEGRFEALTKPAKKLRKGEKAVFDDGLTARVEEDLGEGRKVLRFEQQDYQGRLEKAGRIPLPPYVRDGIDDPERYQTVYASQKGSAAAPTAGLHFTNELLQGLKDIGVETARVTLDVSIDTFRPISSDNVEEHKMHGERCVLPPDTAKKINGRKGRVVAVGTTSVRTIETFAQPNGLVRPGEATTRLFVTPGYRFRAVDAMFTNFHMPGTTMLLLVAALAGTDALMRAYGEAVEKQYRFLSFGDAMLVI